MKRTYSLFLLTIFLALLLTADGNAQSGARHAKAEEAAEASARSWLRLVDAGKYGDAWESASGYFKHAVPEKTFVGSLEGVRAPLGRIMSRSVISATYAETLPGAPDGEYVVILFNTEFEKKRTSVETITPMKEQDGNWRVSGYYIK